jgi:putative RecB family exonuclease
VLIDERRRPASTALASFTESVGGLAYAAAMTASELIAAEVSADLPADVGAVVPRGPWALSPSRAGDFMTCPLLYRFRVIDRLPEPSSPVTTRGTLVHGVLERLFDSPALERTVALAHSLLEPEWQRLLAERPELETLFAAPIVEGDASIDDQISAWLASARVLIETYFALEDPTRVEPDQRELLVEAELADGVRLRGFVDRVDVGRGGATRIVDYKTGNSPSELFEAKALFQLKFYALVMWRMSGTIPAMLQLLYLGDKQVLRYAPDEADLLATERKVRALWAAIERALEQQNFPPRPSRLCDWCAHQALCPAFGGTPPAYPQPAEVGAGVATVIPLDTVIEADDITP